VFLYLFPLSDIFHVKFLSFPQNQQFRLLAQAPAESLEEVAMIEIYLLKK